MRKGWRAGVLRGSVISLLREGAACAAARRGCRKVRRTERDIKKVMNFVVAFVGRTAISPGFLFLYENAPVGARTLRPHAETDSEMRREAGYKGIAAQKSKARSSVVIKPPGEPIHSREFLPVG